MRLRKDTTNRGYMIAAALVKMHLDDGTVRRMLLAEQPPKSVHEINETIEAMERLVKSLAKQAS